MTMARLNPTPWGLRQVLPTIWIAGAITLALTLFRLAGELWGLGALGFSTEAGGAGALFGITWLIPVFGIWFGRRLAARGVRPRRTWMSFAMPLVGLAGLLMLAGSMADKKGEEMRSAFQFMTALGPLVMLIPMLGWPGAFLANLLYGLLARLPVVIVQFVAIAFAWGTHYEKVHPDMPPMTAAERSIGLMLAQAGFWLPLTVLVGSLFAAIGALTVRRTAAEAQGSETSAVAGT